MIPDVLSELIETKGYVTAEQFSLAIGVSVQTARRMIRDGEIKAVDVSRKKTKEGRAVYRLYRHQLESWFTDRETND